jgi:hypothetical protein
MDHSYMGYVVAYKGPINNMFNTLLVVGFKFCNLF